MSTPFRLRRNLLLRQRNSFAIQGIERERIFGRLERELFLVEFFVSLPAPGNCPIRTPGNPADAERKAAIAAAAVALAAA